MAGPSFWEKLGRGVGKGWHKARKFSSEISDQIEGRMELEKAEDALKALYQALGEIVATRFLEGGSPSSIAECPEVKDLFGKIQAQRALVGKLRAEREAERKAAEAAATQAAAAEAAGAEAAAAQAGDKGAGATETPETPAGPPESNRA